MRKPYKLVAKAIIFDQQDRVLILHRSEVERKTIRSHGFDFPGGGLEVDETILEGLAREVFEETGLVTEVVAPASVHDEIQNEKHLVIIKFACNNPKGDLLLSEEHDAYDWVSLQQLPNSRYPDWMRAEITHAYQIYNMFRN